MSGELVRREVGELVGRLSEDGLDAGERGRLLVRLTRALGRAGRAAGARAALSGRWLTDLVADDLAPHVPVRDLVTLRSHYGGLSGDDLAEALISSASRLTAAIGAAGGAVAAAELAAPPALLAAPVQLAAETLAVVAVELKLVAELHVVYAMVPRGTRSEVAASYVGAWVSRRGIDLRNGLPPLSSVVSAAARRQLRGRLVRRLGRSTATLAPFLAGAVAGAELNRRETRSLGGRLVADLRP